jgi:glycosyltransferase involved in cell wall biosynthesis
VKISYLVTCSTETDTLDRLLQILVPVLGEDELITLQDASIISKSTEDIIMQRCSLPNTRWYKNGLNRDYGSHKNFGIQKCEGDFVFQLDGDEFPSPYLIGENLHEWIDSNPDIEAFAIPRINDFKGVTPEHAAQWGWRLSPSKTIVHEKIIDTESSEYKFLKENGYIIEETKIY